MPAAVPILGYPAEGIHPSRLHGSRKPLEELAEHLNSIFGLLNVCGGRGSSRRPGG